MIDLTARKAKAEQARTSHAYRAEGASLRFTEDLVAFMKTSGLTRSALAEKIGSSPAYVKDPPWRNQFHSGFDGQNRHRPGL